MTIIKVTRPFIKITTFFSSEKFKEMMSSTRRPKKYLGNPKKQIK